MLVKLWETDLSVHWRWARIGRTRLLRADWHKMSTCAP